MNDVELTNEFVRLMKPLVPAGKLSLEIHGKPTRQEDIETLEKIVTIGKKYKLHRRIQHCLASVQVRFEPGIRVQKGSFLILRVDSINFNDSMRRMIIISTLFLLLLFIFMKQR